MLLVVRYDAGNGGWALATILNSALGHDIFPSEAQQFEGNAHNTSLYDRLSGFKERMRYSTDVDLKKTALPIHYTMNIPESYHKCIDMYRSTRWEYVPWFLYNKEEDHEYTPEFIEKHIRISKSRAGNFDTAMAFDTWNPDYITNFLSRLHLNANNDIWRFYEDYINGQQRLIECMPTET